MRTKHLLPGVWLAVVLSIVSSSAWPAVADDSDKAKSQTPTADKKVEPAKKDDKDKVLAIVGGDVYTITREVIRGGTVLVKDDGTVQFRPDIYGYDALREGGAS